MQRFVLLFAVVLAGCGAQTIGPTSVTGLNGPFHAVASPASLPAGGTLHLDLTVSGPLTYETGCVQTLHIWAEDSTRQPVWIEPVPAIMCLAIADKTLVAGETATFTADWPTATSLAAGSYTVHGLFLTALPLGAGTRVRENLPPLTVQILG